MIASLVLLAPAVVDWWVEGGSIAGLPYPLWLPAALVANVVLTITSPRSKRLLVATAQRLVVNPLVRGVLALRIPLGWCLLETTGRRTGRRRVVPVGNGLVGTTCWIVAEHGDRAAYVRNIRHDPRVRLLVRLTGTTRMRWVRGSATVLDDDDPYARQRALGGRRHPLRAFNAMTVRVLGTELRTVRIVLDDGATQADPAGGAPPE